MPYLCRCQLILHSDFFDDNLEFWTNCTSNQNSLICTTDSDARNRKHASISEFTLPYTGFRSVPVIIYWGTPYLEQLTPTYVLKGSVNVIFWRFFFYSISENSFAFMNMCCMFCESLYFFSCSTSISEYFLHVLRIEIYPKICTWHPYIYTMQKSCEIIKK